MVVAVVVPAQDLQLAEKLLHGASWGLMLGADRKAHLAIA
jgi:hypothetical protein